MNEILDRIERELVAGIRLDARRRPRRRPRTITSAAALGVLLTASVAVAVAGVTAVTPVKRLLGIQADPSIERLLTRNSELGQRPGTPRVDVSVGDPDGLTWTAVAYTSIDGAVAFTAAPTGLTDRLPSSGFASAFVIADDLLDEPLASFRFDVARAGGATHYLLAGLVDAEVRRVVVTLGRTRQQATVSQEILSAPVDVPRDGLTAQGERRAARMPAEVSLRVFAASGVGEGFARQKTARMRVTMTLADGTRETAMSGPLCVSRKCGMRILRVDG